MAAVQAAVQHVAVLEEEHELDQLINEIDITKLVNINKIYFMFQHSIFDPVAV